MAFPFSDGFFIQGQVVAVRPVKSKAGEVFAHSCTVGSIGKSIECNIPAIDFQALKVGDYVRVEGTLRVNGFRVFLDGLKVSALAADGKQQTLKVA